MFNKKGYIVVEKAKADEEKLMAAVSEAGADDMQDDDDNWEVLSTRVIRAVRDAVKGSASTASAGVDDPAELREARGRSRSVELMEALDDQDDVQHVWSNFDISEQEIEASLA
jgi:transcriptional/translational regulatory protein YebC/TACO1